jgi:hypothetical protein
MTHSTIKPLPPVFSKILLGSPAKLKDILLVGSVMGGIGAAGPLYEMQPILFFLPFAWFLFVCTKVYNLLQNPRSGDLAFVLGMHYTHRMRLCTNFVKRKNAELAAIAVVCIVAFLAVRLILYKSFVLKEALITAEIMAAEIAVLWGILHLLVAIPLIRPSAKNIGSTTILSLRPTFIAQRFSKLILTFQNIPFMSKSQGIIIKRQLLYLIRFDLVSVVFFNITALIVSALIFALAKPSQGLLLGLFCLVPPVILLLEVTACMSESAKFAGISTHYDFKDQDIFTVNTVIAFLFSLPYVSMYLVKTLLVSPVFSLENNIRVWATILSFVLVCITMAYRWQLPDWTNVSASCLGFALLCGLVGISVPLYGFLFPLLGIVLVWWLNKSEKRNTNG